MVRKNPRAIAYRRYKALTGATATEWPKGSTEEWEQKLLVAKKNIKETRYRSQVKKVIDDLYITPGSFTIKLPNFRTKKVVLDVLLKNYRPNSDKKLFLELPGEGKGYTFSDDNVERLKELVYRGKRIPYIPANQGPRRSDEDLVEDLFVDLNELTIRTYIPEVRVNENKGGRFFKYFLNNASLVEFINSEQYGIYNSLDKKSLAEVCFIKALEEHNILSIEEIQSIKHLVKNRRVPKKDFKTICKKLNIQINIRTLDKNNNIHSEKIGKSEIVFNIGLIDEHYFILKETNITAYALINFETIDKNKKDWNLIKGKCRHRTKPMDSFNLVRTLLENKDKMLTEIKNTNDIYSTQYHDLIDKIENLEYNENLNAQYANIVERIRVNTILAEQLGFNDNDNDNELRKVIDSKQFPKIFFDIETSTTDENGNNTNEHEIILICSKTYIDNKLVKSGTYYTVNEFIESITEDSLLIAHNLGYDFRFILKSDKVYLKNHLEKGNRIMQAEVTTYSQNNKKGTKLNFKDSNFLITSPLSKFPQMFKFEETKEVIPYKLYTQTNKNNFALIKHAINILKEQYKNEDYYIQKKQIKQFKNNIIKLNLSKDGIIFDHMKYLEYYCDRDCEVLAKGYLIFRDWIKQITNLDIDKFISIPSIVDQYFIDSGCYDGVYELSGTPRQFIQQSLVGGRCMTRDNLKHHVTTLLQDFDAVSLYPSAMKRLKGFLKGLPKILKEDQLNYDTIKNFDGYFVEIIFNRNARINRHFPLVSFRNDQSIRNFTNEFKDELITVDKTTLEDIIKFHGMRKNDFEIIRGYYFNEGFNTKIKDTIQFLFEERLKKKKEGNPIQEVYKLLMNASYGKTIMKPIKTEKKIFNTEAKAMKYVYRNTNYVSYYKRITHNKFVVKTLKSIDDHYSKPHVGCSILSMSKRIMNEVMCLAEDMDIEIYYQDTDSMHIEDDKVNILANKFKEIYGRDLIGSNMGQFHCDFDFKHDEGKLPVSIESYFLGKKSYIDKVKAINNGVTEYHNHIRLKGIPAKSIICKGDPMDIYKNMYKGKSVEFDLLEARVCFEFNNNYSIKNKDEFKRIIQFN